MLKSQLKVALRVLARRKFFTFVSLFGTGFTLAVLMVVAALADHLLAPYAPETHLDRILQLPQMQIAGEHFRWSGNPGYRALDTYVRTLPYTEAVSIYRSEPTVSFLDGEKVELRLVESDAAYWQVLEFEFLEGGPFTASDDSTGQAVAVINQATRRRFFAGQQALGQTVAAGGQTYRVVGVVADVPAFRPMAHGDLYAPLGSARSQDYRADWLGNFHAIVLAKTKDDRAAIDAALQDRISTFKETMNGEVVGLQGRLRTRFEEFASELWFRDESQFAPAPTARAALMVAAVALLFMALPAINLVNINISRIYERAGEIGARKAFGASTLDLIGQFVVENVVLSLLGGAIGLAGAFLGLLALHHSAVIPHANMGLNLRIFAEAVVLALLFGVLSGIYPAWRMSRLHPVEALRGGPR